MSSDSKEKSEAEMDANAERMRSLVTDETLIKLWAAEEKAYASVAEGAKGFALLNSAGVAALLAFIQAMAVKDAALLTQMKPWWLTAITLFLVGAVTSTTVSIAISNRLIGRLIGAATTGVATAAKLAATGALSFVLGATALVMGLALKF